MPKLLRPQSTETLRSSPIIGWREWVAIPELGIPAIKAKIDTGARTSALHVSNVELLRLEGGAWVRFGVCPLRKRSDVIITCMAPLLEQRLIRDSGGHSELRYVIQTNLRLGALEWPVELTLTARNSMLFRILVGRTAIRDRFLVDSGASFLIGAQPSLTALYPKSRL